MDRVVGFDPNEMIEALTICSDADDLPHVYRGLLRNAAVVIEVLARDKARFQAESREAWEALVPFIHMAGQRPLSYPLNDEPLDPSEPVNVSVCGFPLGDLSVSDLDRAFNLSAKAVLSVAP